MLFPGRIPTVESTFNIAESLTADPAALLTRHLNVDPLSTNNGLVTVKLSVVAPEKIPVLVNVSNTEFFLRIHW